MKTIFVVNPSLSNLEIIDAINQKIDQAQAIVDCALIPECNGGDQLIIGLLLTISDILDDIKKLQNLYYKKRN